VNFRKEIETEIHKLLLEPNLSMVLSLDEKLDQYFNINVKKIEDEVISHEVDVSEDSIYPGLDPRALLTSYVDYYQILSDIPAGEELIDLGAGYCRGTILSQFLDLSKCRSIEVVDQRVRAAKDCLSSMGGSFEEIIHGDLLEVEIPEAYGYFFYFPKGSTFYRILRDFFEKVKSKQCFVYVCESHGDVIDYMDMFSFFKRVKTFKVSQPRHKDYIIKYEVKPITVDLNWSKHLPEWLLYNTSLNQAFTIQINHSFFGETVSWLVPVEQVELILYNREKALFNGETGRIISIQSSEPITNIEELSSTVSKWVKSHSFKKLLYHQGLYYQELSSGSVLEISELN
jgi:hypothetical protein